MNKDQEIRAKALEMAIQIYEKGLDFFQAKPQVHDTQSIDVLYRLADSVITYLSKPL
jgi:hypothetical protein